MEMIWILCFFGIAVTISLQINKLKNRLIKILKNKQEQYINIIAQMEEKCVGLEQRLEAQQLMLNFLQEELLALEWLRDNKKPLLPDRSQDGPPSYSQAARKFNWNGPLSKENKSYRSVSPIPATLKTGHQ